MRIVFAVWLLVVAASAEAQIYKCVEAGRTVFSDSPCSATAKPITVKPAAGGAAQQSPTEAAQPPAGSVSPPAPGKSLADRADLAARKRGLDNEIDFKERHIISLRSEMNAELDALRRKKAYANNNLAGATWEQSISEEMNSVVSNYKIRIDGLQSEVSRLRDQRAQLDRE